MVTRNRRKSNLTREQRSAIAKKGWETRRLRARISEVRSIGVQLAKTAKDERDKEIERLRAQLEKAQEVASKWRRLHETYREKVAARRQRAKDFELAKAYIQHHKQEVDDLIASRLENARLISTEDVRSEVNSIWHDYWAFDVYDDIGEIWDIYHGDA